ncbi:MAG: HD-GYP domain-containing protein [Vicinamibacterales bacterium]
MTEPLKRSTILIAHHDPVIGRHLEDTLASDGHEVALVSDPGSAIHHAGTNVPDVLLVSVELAGREDLVFCRQWRLDAQTRLVPLVLVSDHADRESRVRGLDSGADDFLGTPVDRAELLARVRSLVRLKRSTDEMDSAAAIITTLAVMIEARDGYSEGHCHRMANYATALGRALGLGDADLQALRRGGFLHDIGMLAIPDSVLRTKGPLTPEEYRLVQSHTVIGDELCGNLRSLQAIRPIVRSHHERLDGSGYPDGLRGDEVPLLAQIIGIVDVFDAITSRRAYHDEQPASQALDVLHRQVDLGWRRGDLVRAFADLVQEGKLGAV